MTMVKMVLAAAGLSLAVHAADFPLFYNEDCSNFFCIGKYEQSEAGLRRYLDGILRGDAGGVTHFVMNVGAQRLSYDSKAGEPIWKLDKGAISPKSWTINNWITNCQSLAERGIDPYAVWIDHCRKLKVSPWVSLRMNDCHNVSDPNNPLHAAFWREHPEYRTKSGSLNYKYEPVRARVLAILAEMLERYDADGLELDWMRHGHHLTDGREREEASILTDFMRTVRDMTRAAEKRRGHPITLGVRVPTRPEVSLALGMDAFAWAKEDLCDVVVPTCFFDTNDFDIPLADWEARFAAAGAKDTLRVYPCTDNGIWKSVDAYVRQNQTIEEVCGWADHVIAQGAKGIYLFNAFCYNCDDAPEVERFIVSGGLAPERVRFADRAYPLSWHDVTAAGIPDGRQLPKRIEEGKTVRVALPPVGRPLAEEVYVTVGYDAKPEGVAVALNGSPARAWEDVPAAETFGDQTPKSRKLRFARKYGFDPRAVRSGRNELTLAGAGVAKGGLRAWGAELYLRKVAQAERPEKTRTSGPETWGRPAQPAVVNPVGGEDRRNVITLDDWLFKEMQHEIARHVGRDTFVRTNCWAYKSGIRKVWGKDIWHQPEPIKVLKSCLPWEAQGIGEPGFGQVWDAYWDSNRIKLRHKHVGEGWYGKYFTVPADWQGKRVFLKIGEFCSQGLVWLNGEHVAWNDCHAGAYKYEITDLLKPAGEENFLAIQVSSARSSRKGQRMDFHQWGGITRPVELEALPEFYVDDAWVRGRFDARRADVHVVTRGTRPKSVRLRVTVRPTAGGKAMAAERELSPFGDETVVSVPLDDFRPWSPEHPNLYWADVELVADGQVTMTRRERFGVKKFEVRGKELYLNDRPFFLRGFGDDSQYPLTGASPADRAYHLAHLKTARAAGFNGVRLHTHCEVPEYFEAADEAGIMIQTELPYYGDTPAGGQSVDPERDLLEVYEHYRRYVSWSVASMGNEGSMGPKFDAEIHAFAKGLDPDRLAIGQDANMRRLCDLPYSDYYGGPGEEWKRGAVERKGPFVCHEYLNRTVKFDSRISKDFSGVVDEPYPRAEREAWLGRYGLSLAFGDRLQDAQHALQRHWHKHGVESARLDPFCDGFHFWTIVDAVIWNGSVYTAQGLFDAFWRPKRNGTRPEDLRAFNGPTALLVDREEDFVFTGGETVELPFVLSHYGDAPLKGAKVKWSLSGGASGEFAIGDQPLGAAREVGRIALKIPELPAAAKLVFRAEIPGVTANAWEFWVYPKRAKRRADGIAADEAWREALGSRYDGVLPLARAAEAKVVIARWDDRATIDAALKRGQHLITFADTEEPYANRLGWWNMGRQVGTVYAQAPELKYLPHEGAHGPFAFRLLRQSRMKLPVEGVSEKDLLIAGEGGFDCFAYLVRKPRPDGKKWYASFGVCLADPHPECAALLDGLLDQITVKEKTACK